MTIKEYQRKAMRTATPKCYNTANAALGLTGEAGEVADEVKKCMLDEFLSELDGVPTMLIGNAALLTKIRSCARRAGYLTHSEDAFGRQMSGYNGIPFMDMQYYYDTAEKKEKPVVPITSREYGASSSKTTVTGLTDLYAVRLGLDGFHAVSPMGGKVISTTLPDFSTAGPVKAGDVEMVAATVLKKSRAAGVLRNFKVK